MKIFISAQRRSLDPAKRAAIRNFAATDVAMRTFGLYFWTLIMILASVAFVAVMIGTRHDPQRAFSAVLFRRRVCGGLAGIGQPANQDLGMAAAGYRISPPSG